MLERILAAQQQMNDLKQRLESILVEGEYVGVKVTATATNRIVGVEIPDELLGDKDQLEDFLTLAINRALENAKNVSESEMKAIAGSMFPNSTFPGIE